MSWHLRFMGWKAIKLGGQRAGSLGSCEVKLGTQINTDVHRSKKLS
jgi:hypothetical protein